MYVYALSIGSKFGQKKINVAKALFIKNYGLENDIHAGAKLRQVSLLGIEEIELMQNYNKKRKIFEPASGANTQNLLNDSSENSAEAFIKTSLNSFAESLTEDFTTKAINDFIKFNPGDFAENITTKGIKLYTYPLETCFRLGNEVVLELTQIGKSCHGACNIKQKVGHCLMPSHGVFCKVIVGGVVKSGDKIIVL